MAMMPALAVVMTAGSVTAAYGVGNGAIIHGTTEQPSTGLVLVADRQGMVEPVDEIGVPEQGAVDVNIDVREASGIHHRADIIRLVLEDDAAAVGSFFVATV